MIQQIYLTKSELKKILSAKVESVATEELTLTTRALLHSMSFVSHFVYSKQITVKITDKLPINPLTHEHQKDYENP